MTLSAQLKHRIEEQLAHRIPSALSPAVRLQTVRHRLAHEQLTAVLQGGVPVGAITEVHGAACSGRTSLALSLASAVTSAGNVAAWVDVVDAFDPESAALCGVDLQRVFWVRCVRPWIESPKTSAATSALLSQTATQVNRTDKGSHTHRPVGPGGCGSPHPRGESRGMPEAIDALLQAQPRSAAISERRANKGVGTPGMPNRDVLAACSIQGVAPGSAPPLQTPARSGIPAQSSRIPMPFPHASRDREEQIPTDRQPSRRGGVERNAATSRSHLPTTPQRLKQATPPHRTMAAHDIWARLDQALRTVDLLLQAGGFSLLVLDLGGVPAETAWRIPLATWFRFRAGCERSRTSLLVISQHPCTRASANMTVAMQLGTVQGADGTVTAGCEYRLRVEQQRRDAASQHGNVVLFRKPVQADRHADGSHTWAAASAWSVRA